MVDEVLTSCYPSVPHDLSHIGMAPIRWFPKMIEWIFGDDNESKGYVMISEEFGKWTLPDGQLIEY